MSTAAEKHSRGKPVAISRGMCRATRCSHKQEDRIITHGHVSGGSEGGMGAGWSRCTSLQRQVPGFQAAEVIDAHVQPLARLSAGDADRLHEGAGELACKNESLIT